jgi:5-formyltetrahydrofolate cyclo-ligase
MTKAEIRIIIKEKRNALKNEEQIKESSAIHTALFKTEAYVKCKYLFTYVSFNSEVSTISVIQQALKEHKRVFVPKTEQKMINFYEIADISLLKPGKLGIPEPDNNSECLYQFTNESKRENNLMLLPGLAFDITGNRIGYGAGYYDRYLKNDIGNHFIKFGLAYDFQIVNKINTEENDIKVDCIITPTNLIQCGCQKIR